jgi:hypothetical protein
MNRWAPALFALLALLSLSCGSRPSWLGAPRSAGVLTADIGMTFDEVKRLSTLRVKEPRLMGNGSRMCVERETFDFRLGDSGVTFPGSRYYWLETGKAGDPHLIVLNIGITPEKLAKPQLDAFQRRLQGELRAAGWMPGHYLAKTEETRRLWGGKNTTGDGRYWARGNSLLIFETSLMDEQKRDEPPGTGEFILSIALRPKAHEPTLIFERSAWAE